MSERERWIVYPLLFLALGASLRDKLVDRTTTKSIACQELLIVDEQPLGREPVLLARLGGIPRVKADDPYGGQFVLNGQIQVIDRDLNQYHSANRLVTIGRAQFGSLGLGGMILVNGAINATFYAYQGQPIVPMLRGGFPGSSLPAEIMRAVPQALAPHHPTDAAKSPLANPQSAPPTPVPADSSNDAPQPPQPAPTDGEPPSQPPVEQGSPDSARPLADPDENR